jgi:hypothetical protein
MVAALFCGALLSAMMIGAKKESVMYRLDLRPKHVVEQVASEYFEAIRGLEGKPPMEEACRKQLVVLFGNDLRRVEWTLNGELTWQKDSAPLPLQIQR